MKGPRDYHIKWSKSNRKGNYMISLTNGIKKMTQMNLFIKQKQTHRLWKQTRLLKGKPGGGDKLGVWDIHTTTYKTDNPQGLAT